jgi:hypothetical protein
MIQNLLQWLGVAPERAQPLDPIGRADYHIF